MSNHADIKEFLIPNAQSGFVTLNNRALITITGDDRIDFLQGLITQDITRLEQDKIQYSCLLTPQGKFLYDFFLYHHTDHVILECEAGIRAQSLCTHLKRYKLRSKVELSIQDNQPVYALFDDGSPDFVPDPRHPKMGYRGLTRPNYMDEIAFDDYDQHRIALNIPNGSRDMIPEKSTLLEFNIDKLNGIDFDKGCYMGQELTARMHHRNLGKKHCRPLLFTQTPPPCGDNLYWNDSLVGQMGSSCNLMGLGVIKDTVIETIKNGQNNNDTENQFCLLGL